MVARGMAVVLLIVFGASAALAQNTARINWYGVYTVSSSKEIDDPTSPTGKRFLSTPVAPKENTDQIPGQKNLRFGFSYVMPGKGKGTVQVKHVYRFPGKGMPDSVAGGFRSTDENLRNNRHGESVLIGWNFGDSEPDRILEGEWILEVWAGGNKIAERRFNIYRP